MTINHATLEPHDDVAVVFAELLGFTCSICAPAAWDAARVIAFAEDSLPSRAGWHWVPIDKSKLGLGSSTPHACNQYPKQRQHWFMMRKEEE